MQPWDRIHVLRKVLIPIGRSKGVRVQPVTEGSFWESLDPTLKAFGLASQKLQSAATIEHLLLKN